MSTQATAVLWPPMPPTSAAHSARRDPVDLDLVTAGALVGLATGPFRVQQPGWRHEIRRRIGLAERLVRHAGEENLSVAS
jgi:hypothetical protein